MENHDEKKKDTEATNNAVTTIGPLPGRAFREQLQLEHSRQIARLGLDRFSLVGNRWNHSKESRNYHA